MTEPFIDPNMINDIKTENLNIENFNSNGESKIAVIHKVDNMRIITATRTPFQLFKASVAITGGVLFTVGLVLFASRSLEYIKTFF